jgi:hypothetical protein
MNSSRTAIGTKLLREPVFLRCVCPVLTHNSACGIAPDGTRVEKLDEKSDILDDSVTPSSTPELEPSLVDAIISYLCAFSNHPFIELHWMIRGLRSRTTDLPHHQVILRRPRQPLIQKSRVYILSAICTAIITEAL